MTKRIAWLAVSCLMVLSLVLASCAPKVAETTPTPPTAPTAPTAPTTPTAPAAPTMPKAPAVEAPQYGGWSSGTRDVDPQVWDEIKSPLSIIYADPLTVVAESLLAPDPLRGPRGTGEWTGVSGVFVPVSMVGGNLAESLEVVEPDTFIFHIRQGVHWQDKPPAKGREMRAEDVVFSLVRAFQTTGTYSRNAFPYLRDMTDVKNSIYVDPEDPWAAVVKAKPGYLGQLYEHIVDFVVIIPSEVGQLPGGAVTRWQDMSGTGEFILTDFVSGSSWTFERNPGYWRKDPFYPQNQLPYIDGFRVFVIPDVSTRMAALRTGKIDILDTPEVKPDDANSLKKTNPELQWTRFLFTMEGITMRHDVKPFDNVKVRQAMMMAINQDEVVNDFYDGDAVKFVYPTLPEPETADMYLPLEQMPQDVQELWEYHPDKAAKLLDEAGYPGPNRFTTSVTVGTAEQIDMASIIKDYWARVGVTLNLDVKESSVFRAMGSAKTHPHGYYGTTNNDAPRKFQADRFGSGFNYGMINDPVVEATWDAVTASYISNRAEHARIIREATPELQRRALHMFTATPYNYVLWQPWVKNYHGERNPEYKKDFSYYQYLWIDQELKKSMGR